MLTAAGQKILGHVEVGHEESAHIQQRLEEINQRWNLLKAKGVSLRYI